MRATARVVLALLLVAAPVVVHAEDTGQTEPAAKPATSDFSGTWILDVERSWTELSGREPLPAETLTLRQSATTLVLEGDPVRDLRASSIPLHDVLRSTADGETRDVESRWLDGRLFVSTGWSRAHATSVATVLWSLSRDGNELTLDGTALHQDFSRPNVTVKTELKFLRVYRRQR
jgi:hypothetical protein